MALENFEKKTYKKHMSHSSKCSGGRDVLLDLFSSRVPVTCDAKTRSYQYSSPVFITCVRNCLCKVRSLNIVASIGRDDVSVSLFPGDKVYQFRSKITNFNILC